MAPDNVDVILDEVRRHAVRSVHYVGMADVGLIRALKAELGPNLSIMDYFDRWGSGVRLFADDNGLPLPPRPNWMNDVTCYQEGCPEAELLVFDLIGRDAEFLLDELAAPATRRKPFRRIAIANESLPRPPLTAKYRWEVTSSFWIGAEVGA